jgi:4-hydroxybenzoate polyprenyltransferase
MRALDAITKGTSERRAALDYGIPRSTIRDYLHDTKTRHEAAIPLQKLAPVQESRLTEWILVQEGLGHSPTHSQIKAFAQQILATRGDDSMLGKRWIQRFLKRNPILKTKKEFRIDLACVNEATSDIIKPWFQKLDIPEIKAILPENRWNIDEAGIMEGQGVNGLVVGSVNQRFVQKKQPGSKS